MSTVHKVNFEPVSDVNPIHRRDFPLFDKTLSDPSNPLCLLDGEWMSLNNDQKLVRAADVATVGTAVAGVSFPLFAERGRTDVMAMADRKMPVLFLGQYEFDTRLYSVAANIGGSGNAAIANVLQPVKAMTITIGTRNYIGLVGSSYSDNAAIVGYVTRLPSKNGGKLRFMSGWAVRNGAT
jgi:hypothetical protein